MRHLQKSSLTHFPYLTVPPCVCVRTILCGVIFFLHEMTFYAINCCKTLINLLPESNPRQMFEYSTNYYWIFLAKMCTRIRPCPGKAELSKSVFNYSFFKLNSNATYCHSNEVSKWIEDFENLALQFSCFLTTQKEGPTTNRFKRGERAWPSGM